MNDPQGLIDSVNVLPKIIESIFTIVCVVGAIGFLAVVVRSFLTARGRSSRYRR